MNHNWTLCQQKYYWISPARHRACILYKTDCFQPAAKTQANNIFIYFPLPPPHSSYVFITFWHLVQQAQKCRRGSGLRLTRGVHQSETLRFMENWHATPFGHTWMARNFRLVAQGESKYWSGWFCWKFLAYNLSSINLRDQKNMTTNNIIW